MAANASGWYTARGNTTLKLLTVFGGIAGKALLKTGLVDVLTVQSSRRFYINETGKKWMEDYEQAMQEDDSDTTQGKQARA